MATISELHDVARRQRRRATESLRDAERSLKIKASAAITRIGEAYHAALDWKDAGELSNWLTAHLSSQYATITSKAMDAEYLRSHIGGGWHRLYDGGHTLAGSWNAVRDSLPDASIFDHVGIWANEYWKDLITTRGMPIVLLDHADKVSGYFKHLDSVNLTQILGGDLTGISICCNWNDPDKLVEAAASVDCSSIAYANIIAPLVSLIGLGRAVFLNRSEQQNIQRLLSPALKGLTRSGASILLITVIPGGFLIHLSSGIIISLAHGYVWEKGTQNKQAILAAIKQRLVNATGGGRNFTVAT